MAVNLLPRWLVLLSVILVALACFATELAFLKPGFSYTSERWVEIGFTLLLVGVLLTVVLRLPVATRSTYRLPLLVHLITLILFLLPVGQAVLGRLTGYQGLLLEVVFAGSLRNLAMALACMIYWPRLLYTAVMVSLFLMVFALVQGEGQLLLWVLACYSVLGCLWLLGLYWIRLVKDHHSGPAPWGVIGLLVLVVTGILVMTMIGPAKAAQTLWGFLPSSGGRDDYDPFSRGGVNTGDEVIRGSQDSKSTGMTDSDYFLDSPDDALYDVTHDLYGDVVKPRNWQRAISIPAEKMLKKELIPAESLDASREFSLLRKPPPPAGDMESTGAAALIYIQGRVPAHLRLKAYDLFDGLIWSEPVYHGASGNIERDDPPWMKINTFDVPNIFALRESHVIKVAKFKTEALPFPANVFRFRVGKVDDRSFFGWSQDGILKMADRILPKGTVTYVESSMVDPHALEQLDWERPARFYNYLSLPGIDGLPEKLENLAERYVTGIPRGWKQIEAIIAGVKNDFHHNRLAQPPLDCRDVLSHFLNTGEGRDVDFATLAAMLLRTQGYPCRVVSGFYGNPAHHDAKTDHTFVYKDDVHFWV
ncbi:MAG TPA: transglutaminase domain-containing protein, partial [Gemmatales bacterium]|nr:transglutaminase domain-containing protein [Gemmatales bacterium]